MTRIVDSTDRLHLEVDRNLRIRECVIEATQDIPSSFLDHLAAERTHQDAKFAPDEVKLCSLPGAVVDHWFRNGFNIFDKNVTPSEILARLNAEDLGKFITTSKIV